MAQYSDKLLNYFNHLNHAGRLESGVSKAIGSKEQGDLIEFFVEINNETIQQIRFQCFGSVPSLAACEFICCWLENKKITEIDYLTVEQILLELGLSSLQNHVANRILHCLKGILDDYLQS